MKYFANFLKFFLCFLFSLSSCGKGESEGYQIDLIPVSSGEYFGYITQAGNFKIPPQFKFASYFVDGLALAQNKDEKFGYINESGSYVIKPIFKAASDFSEDLASVTLYNSHPAFINREGEVQFEVRGAQSVSDFHDGMAKVTIADKIGFINKTGTLTINPQFDDALAFSDGLAAVAIEKGVDEENRSLFWGFIDKYGRYLVNPHFEEANRFSEGLALIKVNGKYGFIDKNAKYVINPQYEEAEGFSEGLAKVALESTCGYIDKKGNWEINPQFEKATSFKSGLATVKSGHSWGAINLKGQYVFKPQFHSIKPFVSGIAIVADDGNKWGLINQEGSFVVNPQFNHIREMRVGYDVYTDYFDKNRLLEGFKKFLKTQEFLKRRNFTVGAIQNNYSDAYVTDRSHVFVYVRSPLSPDVQLESLQFIFNEQNPVFYGGNYHDDMNLHLAANLNSTASVQGITMTLRWNGQTVGGVFINPRDGKLDQFVPLLVKLISKEFEGKIKRFHTDCIKCPDNNPYIITTPNFDFQITFNSSQVDVTCNYKSDNAQLQTELASPNIQK